MKKVGFLLGFVFGVGAVALWASGLFWWTSQQTETTKAAPASLAEEEKAYKDRLELYGKRADDLERLLTLLLGGSTVYALAVGVNAYQQAKDAKEKLTNLATDTKHQTDALLANSQKQIKAIDDLVVDAKARITTTQAEATSETKELIARSELRIARYFPLFQDMDVALGRITHKILNLLPSLDVVDGKFQQLSEQQIQEILFYEKAMSTFEFFNTEPLKSELSGMFHGLGNFYALKFKASENERGRTNQAAPTSSQDKEADKQDRERARFYLDYAISKDRRNMAALNDRGYFALIIDHPENREEAARNFLASLAVDDDQQRARYNLALNEHRAKSYQKSLEIIDVALEKTKWQKGPRPERIPDLWYNRACSLACLAGTKAEPESTRLLEAALKDLERVAAAEKANWVELYKSFEADLKTKAESAEKDGDLILLLQRPESAAHIRRIRQKLAEKMNTV
jgi:hypothetical protein